MILAELKDELSWQSWFAWYPTWIGNRLIWLQTVERIWDDELNHWLDSSGYGDTDGGWKYRLLEEVL